MSDWDAWTQGRGGGVGDMQQVGLLERQASLKGSASQQFEAYKRSLGSQ